MKDMIDLTENLTIRCSPVDGEIIDRLRATRNRSAILRSPVRTAGLGVRRGHSELEEETE
jgi:hypothetical protein